MFSSRYVHFMWSRGTRKLLIIVFEKEYKGRISKDLVIPIVVDEKG